MITSENKESESSLDGDVLWCSRLEGQIRGGGQGVVFHISCVRFKVTEKISSRLVIFHASHSGLVVSVRFRRRDSRQCVSNYWTRKRKKKSSVHQDCCTSSLHLLLQ